jgi:hypothetical protein
VSPPASEPPGPTGEAGNGARGFNSASLGPVWQLNAYFVETLAESCRHPAWRGSAWETTLGPNLASVLPILREELSRAPVSLVDLGLSDEGVRSLSARVHDGPPAFLAWERALQLAQTTLTLTWTLARSDPVAASIVFGVQGSQAREINAVGFHDLPGISETLAPVVRPRWLGQPRIWRRLLRCPDRAITAHLPPRNVRILQRQLADLIPETLAKCLFDDDRRGRRS